nr:hypothetical protein [Tanacetum cinerariifolium]
MQPVAPPLPDYIPGPEEPHTPLEQPLPPVVLPIAKLPGYVIESYPEEDPKEYEDDETEDGPVHYPMDEGDDGDNDDGDSSGFDADDKDEDEEDEEEEEHLASADSAVVIPTAFIPLPPEAEVERLLAMPTPPPSPFTSLSPPSLGERLARMASTQALINAVSAALPSPPLPLLPPPIYLPLPVERSDDIPETEMPPRKRSCLFALGSRYEICESFTARATGGQVDPAEAVPEIAPMTLGERVDLLMEDRIAHQETILIVEEEAYAAREDWAHSIGLSQAINFELQTHREQVYAHEFELHAHQTQPQLQGTLIQTQHQALGTDGRDSLSDGRHETRDGQLMAPVTRQGLNNPPNNTNLNNMNPESVQAMIDQALL